MYVTNIHCTKETSKSLYMNIIDNTRSYHTNTILITHIFHNNTKMVLCKYLITANLSLGMFGIANEYATQLAERTTSSSNTKTNQSVPTYTTSPVVGLRTQHTPMNARLMGQERTKRKVSVLFRQRRDG